jgi:hypothetical protein
VGYFQGEGKTPPLSFWSLSDGRLVVVVLSVPLVVFIFFQHQIDYLSNRFQSVFVMPGEIGVVALLGLVAVLRLIRVTRLSLGWLQLVGVPDQRGFMSGLDSPDFCHVGIRDPVEDNGAIQHCYCS